MVLVVHASVSATDLKGFIDFARGLPQGIEYATSGIGSLGHLTTELFAQKAGLKLTHVPYKGSAPAVMAVLWGGGREYMSANNDALPPRPNSRQSPSLCGSPAPAPPPPPTARPPAPAPAPHH